MRRPARRRSRGSRGALEVIPRQWKVIQTVREKFTCRHCEKISQPPAPFHPTPRGWAGPNLLAMIVFEKYGQHQPLNRQRDRYAREGVDLSLSTLADQVGACTVALRPLRDLIAEHVLAAERLHGDDTPVPVLAKGKTATARAWVYVRDDAPFGGPDPPAALFHYSRDRSGDHPVEHLRTFTGILQADIYAGYNRLYAAGRSPGPVTEAACWAHSRRKFFELADIAASRGRGKNAPPISPLALEAVKGIDVLFDIERGMEADALPGAAAAPTPMEAQQSMNARVHSVVALLAHRRPDRGLARLIRGDGKGHQRFQIDFARPVGFEQHRCGVAEPQPLLHGAFRDPEARRDGGRRAARIGQAAECLDLIGRVHGGADTVLGQRNFFGRHDTTDHAAGHGVNLVQRALGGQRLHRSQSPTAGDHSVARGAIRAGSHGTGNQVLEQPVGGDRGLELGEG